MTVYKVQTSRLYVDHKQPPIFNSLLFLINFGISSIWFIEDFKTRIFALSRTKYSSQGDDDKMIFSNVFLDSTELYQISLHSTYNWKL